MLARCFISKEKNSRLSAECHTMSLTLIMEKSADESEVAVFGIFISRLMSLQHQLHNEYHSDRQVRDRLLNVLDIPTGRNLLRDRTLRPAHQLINRVANCLSTEQNTAASIFAHVATSEPYHATEEAEHECMSSIGQRYG